MDTPHPQRNDSQSELYLIAHKVRGEPAFDIATRFKCPICEPIRQGLDPDERGSVHCAECDEGQHWWVIPTSGHRAYPYWFVSLGSCISIHEMKGWRVEDMPADLPDHYQTHAKPGTGITDLFSKLGFQRATTPQVTRRI